MRSQRARISAGEGSRNLTLVEASIERSREALKQSQRYLETDGAEALNRAIQKSKKFGQQSEQMSTIAREAREAADKLKETVVIIESTAQEALNTSSSAYLLARDAVDQQKNTTEELTTLDAEIGETEKILLQTKLLAKEALKNAQSAYNDALALFEEAYRLIVPNVQWQAMKEQAAEYSEESRRIKEEADSLIFENSELLNSVTVHITTAGQLLEKGVNQQQMADELLVDADAALAKSQEAVLLGDKTLEEAQKTLATLQGNVLLQISLFY